MDSRTPTFLLVAGGAAVLLSRQFGANADRVRMAGWLAIAGGVALRASSIAQRVSDVGVIGTAAGVIVGDRTIDAAGSVLAPIASSAGEVLEAGASIVALPVAEFARDLRGAILNDAPPAAPVVISTPSAPVVVAPANAQPALVGLDGENHGQVSGPNAMSGVLGAILFPTEGGSVARGITSSKFRVRLALQNLTDTERTPTVVAVVKVSSLTSSPRTSVQELRPAGGGRFKIPPRTRIDFPDVEIESGSRFEIGDLELSILLRVDGKLAQTVAFEVT